MNAITATVSDYCEFLENLFEELISSEDSDRVHALAESQIEVDRLDPRLRESFAKGLGMEKEWVSKWETE
jgi:hypothetical protein